MTDEPLDLHIIVGLFAAIPHEFKTNSRGYDQDHPTLLAVTLALTIASRMFAIMAPTVKA